MALDFQAGDAKAKLWWWKRWLSSLGLSEKPRASGD